MRPIKPITIALVIGAFALSSLAARLGNSAATSGVVASAHASPGGSATGAQKSGASVSEIHISAVTVRRINDLLRLYGIPLVLTRSDPIAQPSPHGVAVCVASGRDALIIAAPLGDN